jgi:hypothetical protein
VLEQPLLSLTALLKKAGGQQHPFPNGSVMPNAQAHSMLFKAHRVSFLKPRSQANTQVGVGNMIQQHRITTGFRHDPSQWKRLEGRLLGTGRAIETVTLANAWGLP